MVAAANNAAVPLANEPRRGFGRRGGGGRDNRGVGGRGFGPIQPFGNAPDSSGALTLVPYTNHFHIE